MKLIVSASLDINNNLLLRSNDKTLHVLCHIIDQYDEVNSTWYSDVINKQSIADKLNISLSSVDKKIFHLRNNGIIVKKSGKGEYKLNEELFELGY